MTLGCCKERTCADSERKGLEGGLGCGGSKAWNLGGAESDVEGEASDRS